MRIVIIMIVVALAFGLVTALVAGFSCLVYESILVSEGSNV